jgi:hypothetical protein
VTTEARERWLKLLLRVEGAVMLLALVPAVMPTDWLAAAHEWLALGKLPAGVLVEYLARTLSAFYAITGGLLWLVSFDVRRYAAVIGYVAAACVVMGAIAIASVLGPDEAMFRRLAAADAAVAVALGVAMLALLPRRTHTRTRTGE